MPRPSRIHLCLIVLSVSAAAARAQAPLPDARLAALYTEEWTWRLGEMARTDRPGEAAATDHFPRVDAASQQARLAYWTRALATLDSIPFDSLSAEGRINAQVFRATVTALATDIRYRTYEAPFNSDTFFWTEFTPRQGFAAADAYRNYLGRLRDVPRYFDEQIANLRAGLARGYTVPRSRRWDGTRRSSPTSAPTPPTRCMRRSHGCRRAFPRPTRPRCAPRPGR